MYLVHCSSCGQAEKSLFARVGAVITCSACKAVVQLRAEDVKRQFKVRNDLEDDLFRVPQVQRATEEHAAPAVTEEAVATEPTMVEEIHEDHAELAVEAERRADAARRRKTKAQPIVKTGMSSGELAQHLAAKRHKQTAGILIGVAAVVIIGIIFIVSAASNKNGATKDGGNDVAVKDGSPAADGTKDGAVVPSPPVTDGAKDGSVATKDRTVVTPTPNKDKTIVVPPPAMVRVPAVQLGIDDWQPANESFTASPAESNILLVNETNETLASGEHVFKADIVSDGVASALVSVALVNDEDRVYAKFERPYFLLESKKARPLRLVIPKDLIGSSTGVHWAVHPIDTHVKNPTLLADTLAEVTRNDSKPVIRIDAYNPSDRPLKDSAFVIQAMDADGQIVSQWRLKYPSEVGAKSWLKFESELPAAIPKNAASWRVLGAGIATGEVAVAPPPPDTTPKERDPKEYVPPRRGKGLFDF